MKPADLLVRKLLKDEFWFVARADDPLAKTREVAVRELRDGQILLLEEGHCLRDHAISACGARRANPDSMIEATSLHTLIQMVEGGLGVTLLPEMTLKAGILNRDELVGAPVFHSSALANHRTGGARHQCASARLRSSSRFCGRTLESRTARGSVIQAEAVARLGDTQCYKKLWSTLEIFPR